MLSPRIKKDLYLVPVGLAISFSGNFYSPMSVNGKINICSYALVIQIYQQPFSQLLYIFSSKHVLQQIHVYSFVDTFDFAILA